MSGTPNRISSRSFEAPGHRAAAPAAPRGWGGAGADWRRPRGYSEAQRMLVGRAYHDLFKGLGIAPLAGRKLYQFATRLGPAESSIDVSPRMAYIYFRYLDLERAVAARLPSDDRYRSGTFNRNSGKLNGHVVSDEEQTPSADLALQMVEGFRAILTDLEARPLDTAAAGPIPVRFHLPRSH
jgi:hypothetical protein